MCAACMTIHCEMVPVLIVPRTPGTAQMERWWHREGVQRGFIGDIRRRTRTRMSHTHTQCTHRHGVVSTHCAIESGSAPSSRSPASLHIHTPLACPKNHLSVAAMQALEATIVGVAIVTIRACVVASCLCTIRAQIDQREDGTLCSHQGLFAARDAVP